MGDIAYQNKDIALKYFGDALKNKKLTVYGLPHIKIKDSRPTNLPAIEANELRIDNLFILEDDSYALIDYESTFGIQDIIKYVNYIARILKRFIRQEKGRRSGKGRKAGIGRGDSKAGAGDSGLGAAHAGPCRNPYLCG